MAKRQALVISSVLLTAALAVPACSSATRHRVLNFFFDGVPPSGVIAGAEPPSATGAASESAGAAVSARPRPVVYAHDPYRDNRCASCHDAQTGGLYRTSQEGLCRTCHGDITADAVYVHGPTAVRDCLFCHDPHTSSYPNLLLAAVNTTCLRCHDRSDLSTGLHHADWERHTCVKCHDPHGGADPYFLRQAKP